MLQIIINTHLFDKLTAMSDISEPIMVCTLGLYIFNSLILHALNTDIMVSTHSVFDFQTLRSSHNFFLIIYVTEYLRSYNIYKKNTPYCSRPSKILWGSLVGRHEKKRQGVILWYSWRLTV